MMVINGVDGYSSLANKLLHMQSSTPETHQGSWPTGHREDFIPTILEVYELDKGSRDRTMN